MITGGASCSEIVVKRSKPLVAMVHGGNWKHPATKYCALQLYFIATARQVDRIRSA